MVWAEDESLVESGSLEDGEKWVNMADGDLGESGGPGMLLGFEKQLG